MEFIGIIKATYQELKENGFRSHVDFVIDEYIKRTGEFRDNCCKTTSMKKDDEIVLFKKYLVGEYCEFACYVESDYIAEKRLQEGR